jgi:serine/threonine protein kinase
MLKKFKDQLFNCELRVKKNKYVSGTPFSDGSQNEVYKYELFKVARVTKHVQYEDDYNNMLKEAECFLKMETLGIGPHIYEILFTSSQHMIIIMEKFDGSVSKIKSENKTLKLAEMTMKMIKTLAQHDILFFDIKPGNLLYKEIGNSIILKLTDFGPEWFYGYKQFPKKVKKSMKMLGMHCKSDRIPFLINMMITIFCLCPGSFYLQLHNTSNWGIVECEQILFMYKLCYDFKIIFDNYFAAYDNYYLQDTNVQNNFKDVITTVNQKLKDDENLKMKKT